MLDMGVPTSHVWSHREGPMGKADTDSRQPTEATKISLKHITYILMQRTKYISIEKIQDVW